MKFLATILAVFFASAALLHAQQSVPALPAAVVDTGRYQVFLQQTASNSQTVWMIDCTTGDTWRFNGNRWVFAGNPPKDAGTRLPEPARAATRPQPQPLLPMTKNAAMVIPPIVRGWLPNAPV